MNLKRLATHEIRGLITALETMAGDVGEDGDVEVSPAAKHLRQSLERVLWERSANTDREALDAIATLLLNNPSGQPVPGTVWYRVWAIIEKVRPR